MRPTKLFVGGLSQATTSKDLRAHFGQFAKVLDCVAMRSQDGRSRSFGYVTLDCPIAVDKCLAEPHRISGRVVDVKMAVPAREPALKAEAAKRRQKKTVSPPRMDIAAVNEPSSAACTTISLSSIGAPPGLSLPVTGLPSLRQPPPGLPPPPPAASGHLNDCDDDRKIAYTDSEDDMSTAASASSPVTPTVDDTDSDRDSSSTRSGASSAAMALHDAGACKPCNFFAKGRCLSAESCTFCHLPHQKRKPTRQEKRDRRATWLAKQEEKAKEEALLRAVQARFIDLDDYSDFSDEEAAAYVQTPPRTLLNLADYSDASDDDEEPHVQLPSWSRESLLQVRVTMQAGGVL